MTGRASITSRIPTLIRLRWIRAWCFGSKTTEILASFCRGLEGDRLKSGFVSDDLLQSGQLPWRKPTILGCGFGQQRMASGGKEPSLGRVKAWVRVSLCGGPAFVFHRSSWYRRLGRCWIFLLCAQHSRGVPEILVARPGRPAGSE